MSEFLRITGRPKIERDSSGLRKITRTYIVQGEVVTEGRVEQEVFLPYGTPDVEYHEAIEQDLSNGGLTNSEVTGAYLVSQSIDPGSTVNEAVLTRVYQELDQEDPVQIGEIEITRGASDRLTVKKTFIVKNPYTEHYKQGRVGVDSLDIEGSVCFLGTVQSTETDVYTQFIEVYFQDGVLSESIDYKYGQYPNHKLEVRTLRSIDNILPPSEDEGPNEGPWFEVSLKEGPGDDNFGQLGKTVKTAVYAKGYGLISKDEEVKGKEPNTISVTTIKFLTGEDGSVPDSEIPNFTRKTFEGVSESDGYELHTIKGITLNGNSGVVEVTVDYKYGESPEHKLEIARVVAYGSSPSSNNIVDFLYPEGDPTDLGNFVLISEKENTQGEFDIYTSEFARGNGIISERSSTVGLTTVSEVVSLHPPSPKISSEKDTNELSRKVEILDGYQKLTIESSLDESGIVDSREESKNNGALSLLTLTQLGDSWDSANTPVGYVEISERNHRFDRYPAITRVYAKGEGNVSTFTKNIAEGRVYETVDLYPSSRTINPELDDSKNEISKRIEELDGYKKVTILSTSGDRTVVESKVETKNNGVLIVQTITQLGEVWNSLNTPTGYSTVSTRDHKIQDIPVITKVFVKGEGELSETVKQIGKALIRELVIIKPQTTRADELELFPGELSRKVDQLDGHEKITIVTRDLDESLIENTTEERHNGSLIIKKITQLGTPWDDSNTPQDYVETSTRNHEYQDLAAITKTFAKGDGLIESRKSESPNFITETFVYIKPAKDNFSIPTDAVDVEEREEAGYKTYKYSIKKVLSSVESSSEKYNSGLLETSFSKLNKTYTDSDFNGSISSLSREYIDSKNFVGKASFISETAFTDISINYSGGVRTEKTTDYFSYPKSDFKFGGSSIQIAKNLFRNTNIEILASGLGNKRVSISGGVKTITETSIGDQAGSIDDNGGAYEEIAEGIFKNTTITIEDSGFENKRVSVSGGVKTTTVTSIGDEPGSIDDNGGAYEEIAAGIFKNTTVTIEASGFENKRVSISGGLKTTSTITVGAKKNIDPNFGGAYEELAKDIFRNTEINVQTAEFANKRITFSDGLKTTTTTTVGAKKDIDPDFGGAYEELAENIFRNTEISILPASNISTSKSKQKYFTEEINTSVSPSPDYGKEGSSVQVASKLFKTTKIEREKVTFTNTSTRPSNGGAIKVITKEGTSVNEGKYGGKEHIGHDLYVVTDIKYEPGDGTQGKRNYYGPRGIVLTENSTVVKDATLGTKEIGSFERIAPDVYIKKIVTANNSDVNKILSKKTYYDEGLKFTEISYIGTSPKGSGTLVREVTEYEHYGSTTVTIVTRTYAQMNPTSYTTYGTERFILPGVLKSSRVSGLKTVPPKDIMVSVKHEHTISHASTAGRSGLYEAPSAFMSLTVNFLDADDVYSESWGGSNYARTANTSTLNLKKGDTYLGNIVESATFDESGDNSIDFALSQQKPLARTSTLIYSKNGLNIFRNTTTYLDGTVSLPRI